VAVTPVRAMIVGSAATAVGIVLAASGSATAGGVLVVAGWLVLVGAIHRFGRAG
jgi:hypothetical protein